MTKFDHVCQALTEGWKLHARSVETQDRFTLTAPMPPGCTRVAKWLQLESLEDGAYKCSLRAPSKRRQGESRELQRQKLARIGPLRATVVVDSSLFQDRDQPEDEVAQYEPDDVAAVGPVAQDTLEKVEHLKAQTMQAEAEMELQEVRDRAEKFRGGGGLDPAVVTLSEQVRSLSAEVKASQSSRQEQMVLTLLQSMMESQATMQAQMFAAFTKTPANAPEAKDALGSVRELAELLAVLREDAGSNEPKSDASELMSLIVNLQKRKSEPAMPVAPSIPAQPAPVVANPNGAPPPSAPLDLARQRVGAFLQRIFRELSAQADPTATADVFVESPVYAMLPVPFRKHLEHGELSDVLGALQEWAPPEDYQQFYAAVVGDDAKMLWLGQFVDALRYEGDNEDPQAPGPTPTYPREPEFLEQGHKEVPAQSVAIIDEALDREERRSVDPDDELRRRRALEEPEKVDDGEPQG